MAGDIVNTVQPVLSEYFLQPFGLLALSALVPLIIFYLIQKKPEEQVMPAMMFFMKDKKSGKAHVALRKLLRNFLLVFHILLVMGLAATLAHPFLEASATADKTVVIFDRSASMSDSIEEARKFVGSNLGNENTLILAGDDIKVPLEQASSSQVKTRLRQIEAEDVKTDLASALELASDYEGAVIVASDMDQTLTSTNPQKIVENLRNNGRTVKIIDIEEKNSWGIVKVNPDESSSSVDIKNFKENEATIDVQGPEELKKVKIGAGSVETVSFSTPPEKNTIKLEEDSFKPDNTAYVSIPEQENYKVVFLSDSSNAYFEKAIELISFTQIELVRPPIEDSLDADVYVIGETNRILSDTISDIEKDVESGSAMVVFGHSGVFNLGFESLPVKRKSGSQETTLNILEPQKSTFKTEVLNVEKTRGTDYANPSGTMVTASHGKGEVFFYNINDEDFRHKFIYPVFWKHLIEEMTDRPSVRQLNLQTGDKINALKVTKPDGTETTGEVKLDQTGFYTTPKNVYAANLVNEDESYSEPTSIEKQLIQNSLEKRDIQNLGAIIIVVLLLGELAYLYRAGELT